MAMLDPFAPIPVRKKINDNLPVLYKNEIGYVIEKISFIDEHIKETYYKLLFIKFFIEKNNVNLKTFYNDFQLFSNDCFITFMPEGELITNKDLKNIKTFSILKTNSFNNIINTSNKKKIQLKKENELKFKNFHNFFNNLYKKIKIIAKIF